MLSLLNYAKNKKIIEYAWSAFAAPACESCNSAFSELEGRVKPIVEALMRREAINVGAYVDLLDWLDAIVIAACGPSLLQKITRDLTFENAWKDKVCEDGIKRKIYRLKPIAHTITATARSIPFPKSQWMIGICPVRCTMASALRLTIPMM